jgi:DNA-binding NarL/FixJ family response regulator
MKRYALARQRPDRMPSRPPITVVLAHFDDLLAGGLRQLIDGDPNLTVLAADVEHGRLSVVLRAHSPDVAILNADALVKLAEIRELSARHPATRLVLLANDPSEAEYVQLLAFGASACLGADTQSRDVLHAIHLASRGLQVTARAAGAIGRPTSGGHLLTQREAEVLPLLQQNRSNAQIALHLNVGVETVRSHARSIYRKLGVSSRRELAAPSLPEPRQQPGLSVPLPHPRAAVQPVRPRRGHALRHD